MKHIQKLARSGIVLFLRAARPLSAEVFCGQIDDQDYLAEVEAAAEVKAKAEQQRLEDQQRPLDLGCGGLGDALACVGIKL